MNQEKNYIWKVNGLELELDLQDLEATQKYERAFEIMSEEEKLMPKDGKTSEQLRAYYQLFVNLYDNLFGEGLGKQIIGDRVNVRICNDIYDSFLAFVKSQRVEMVGTVDKWKTKYSPNRAQRRASK